MVTWLTNIPLSGVLNVIPNTTNNPTRLVLNVVVKVRNRTTNP